MDVQDSMEAGRGCRDGGEGCRVNEADSGGRSSTHIEKQGKSGMDVLRSRECDEDCRAGGEVLEARRQILGEEDLGTSTRMNNLTEIDQN